MYKAELIKHKGVNRIAVYFDNKPELILRFKKLAGENGVPALRFGTCQQALLTFRSLKLKQPTVTWPA